MPINGHPHASKQRQTSEPTFVARDSERCPDCEDRGKLDALGRPRRVHAQPLRKPTYWISRGVSSSFGCETCGGTGRVKAHLARAGCRSNDPMEIPAKG